MSIPGGLQIREFQPGDAPAFTALNVQWITRLFVLEAGDRDVLERPEETILAPGGAIVMAFDANEQPVGCCALIWLSEGVYELAKMAVEEQLRGQGIGRQILERVLEVAHDRGAMRLYLRSNSALKNAVHLYESLGFRHVTPESVPLPAFARNDVWMQIDF